MNYDLEKIESKASKMMKLLYNPKRSNMVELIEYIDQQAHDVMTRRDNSYGSRLIIGASIFLSGGTGLVYGSPHFYQVEQGSFTGHHIYQRDHSLQEYPY